MAPLATAIAIAQVALYSPYFWGVIFSSRAKIRVWRSAAVSFVQRASQPVKRRLSVEWFVAAKPAENGRNMAAAFAKTGTVRIELKPPPTGPRKLPLGVALTGYQIRLKLEDDC